MERERLHVPKAAEVLAGKLRDEIIRGILKEGDDLASEAKLLEEFHTSKQTLREAFRILESEGLLSLQRGSRSGARVHASSAAGVSRYFGILLRAERVPLSEIFWTEAVVEGFAGQLLAESCTREQLRRLKANLRATEKVSGDLAAQQVLLVEFHELVIDFLPVTALQLLCRMIRTLVNDAIITYTLGAPPTERRTSGQAHTVEDHAEFLEMLAARDSLAAGTFWREHLTASAAAMQDLIQHPQPP